MPNQDRNGLYASVFILLSGLSGIGLWITRDQSMVLFLAYFSAFFAYFWICRFPISFSQAFTFGLFLRLILFFGMPALSDDIYRFIWDGNLLRNGVNPFTHLPTEYLDQSLKGITPELFKELNSKEYYSIYPPLNQLLFWLAATLGESGWLMTTNWIRIFLVGADVGSFFLLRSLLAADQRNPNLANWYWLNPLIILEGTGNIHFEGMIVFFVLLGVYYIHKKKGLYAGPAIGLAAATKLVPLIILPAILFKKWLKTGVLITGSALLVVILSFLPLLVDLNFSGFLSSFALYFRKFEFNASIYFLIREVGFWVKGYNIIGTLGPVLGIISFLGIASLAVIGFRKNWPLTRTMLFSWSFYLLLATTVHPWYILPLIALGILSGYYYPLIWSFFIFTTYFGYLKNGFELSPIWLVLEYVSVLGFFSIETFKKLHAKA